MSTPLRGAGAGGIPWLGSGSRMVAVAFGQSALHCGQGRHGCEPGVHRQPNLCTASNPKGIALVHVVKLIRVDNIDAVPAVGQPS
jgi:hypothetical protein